MVNRGCTVSVVVVILFLVNLSSCGSSGDWETFAAHSFSSSGDYIQGWYWLRDSYLTDREEWTFKGIPEGSGELQFDLRALATDKASGGPGVDARFRLLVGRPGSGTTGGVLCPQEVMLPNVSSPGDPDGYACRGVVTVERNSQCGTNGGELPNGYLPAGLTLRLTEIA